jgi:hypothetical protein
MADQILRPAMLVRRHRFVLAVVTLVVVISLVAVALVSYRSALVASVLQSSNRLSFQVNGLVN